MPVRLSGDGRAAGTLSAADREWTVEHAGEEQLYDIISLLDYDETSVKIWGPTATDPTTANKRLARDFRDPEGRRANSGGAHAAGWRLAVCGDWDGATTPTARHWTA